MTTQKERKERQKLYNQIQPAACAAGIVLALLTTQMVSPPDQSARTEQGA